MTQFQKLCRGFFWSAAILIGMMPITARAGIAVSPLKQEVTVKPGDEGKFTISIVNKTHAERNVTQSVHMSITDVEATEDGSLVFKDPGTAEHSCSKWVTILHNDATIDPGASHPLEFTVKPPLNAAPGEYYCAILVTLATKGRNDKGMTIEYRIASGVFLTVPGRTFPKQAKISRCEMKWPDIAAAGEEQAADTLPPRISLTLQNFGQARIEATGKVALFDEKNRLIYAGPLFSKRPCVFGGDSRLFETPITKAIPVGKYTAKVTLDYQSWAPLRQTLPVEILPEQAALLALLKKRQPNEAIGLEVTPDKLAYTVPARGSRSFALTIKNVADAPVNCNASIFPSESENESADSWITLGTPDCTVTKGAKKTLPVTIRIPAGTKAGKYTSTIALEGGPEGSDPCTLLVPIDVDVKSEK